MDGVALLLMGIGGVYIAFASISWMLGWMYRRAGEEAGVWNAFVRRCFLARMRWHGHKTFEGYVRDEEQGSRANSVMFLLLAGVLLVGGLVLLVLGRL